MAYRIVWLGTEIQCDYPHEVLELISLIKKIDLKRKRRRGGRAV